MVSRSATLRVSAAIAGAIAIVTIASQAEAKPTPTMGALYSVTSDADHDGVPDALDTCPTGVVTPKPAKRSRLPACYLGIAGGVSGPSATLTGLPAVHQFGAWFQANGCVPAMAFPVDDVRADGTRSIGVVIAGTGLRAQDPVLAAALAGLPWPSASDAWCAISINFDSSLPLGIIEVSEPAIPNFYVHWSPTLKTPSAGDADQYIPADGLGLFAGPMPASTRYMVRGKKKGSTFTHVRLTRAAIWAQDFTLSPPWTCPASAPAAKRFRDPVRPADFGAFVSTCLNPAVLQYLKPNFVVVPTGLDDALLSERQAAVTAFDDPYGPTNSYIDAIEGLPNAYAADDRYWDEKAARPSFLLTPSLAAFFAPKAYSGTSTATDPWLIVPASIARTNQHQAPYADKPSAPSTWPYLRPVAAAEYSRRGGGDLPGTRLAFQRFQRLDGAYERAVETIWPHEQPTMATSERHPQFGHRWTTNGGRPDCWTPDATGGHVGFPIGSSIGPGGDGIAQNWCPASVVDWTNEEALNSAGTATQRQSDADALCAPMKAAMDAVHSNAGWAVANCSIKTALVITSELVCCGVGAWVGVGGVCCAAAAATGLASPQIIFECATPDASGYASNRMTNDIHWPDLSTPNHPLVPFFSMVRTQPDPNQPWFTTTKGWVANGDAIVNRSHQASDWNWDIRPDAIDVVDQGYRRLATRDSGAFHGIENELEFQIPFGAWTDNQHGTADWFRHGHSGYGYLLAQAQDFMGGDSTLSGDAPGEFWPNQACDLFGIDEDSEDKTNRLAIPTTSCGGKAYKLGNLWRNHYGRGIFYPIVANPQPADMVVSPQSWRGQDLTYFPPTVPIGVEDWTARSLPHRMGFLGAPIADCGHDGNKVEIHPPHVITYEAACDGPAGSKCNGVTVVAFGWANAVSPASMEFDLWPPPRPSASAQLVTKGERTQLDHPSQMFGYVIDASGPKAVRATSLDQPRMRCGAMPAAHPNHVHCAYSDPAAGKMTPSQSDLQHDNPRMTPNWATSRFDVRFYLGWR